MYITIDQNIDAMAELLNSYLSDMSDRSRPDVLSETHIVIENQGQQHVRVMRMINAEQGIIEFEHRETEELPFQIRIERG